MIRYPLIGAQTLAAPRSMYEQGDGDHVLRLPASMKTDAVSTPFWRTATRMTIPPEPTSPQRPNVTPGVLGRLQSWLTQLLAAMQNMFARSTSSGAPSTAPSSAEQRFQNVTLGSTGDPHLALDGSVTDVNGGTTSVRHHFDSMTSHADLLHSNDFNGGYAVSSTVGAADANGITSNRSATVAVNDGNDSITMSQDGSIGITSDGQAYTLANGQSMQLDGGETVTRNQDGSLTLSERSASGGSLATTLTSTGAGVDITATGHNVDVGGDIVNGIVNETPLRDSPPNPFDF